MDQNKLKKEDMIYLDHKGDHINLFTDKKDFKKEERSMVIDAEDKTIPRIEAEIVSAYLSNYDLINVRIGNQFEKSSEVKRIVRNLTGMEIISETNEHIMAKDLLNKGEISIKMLLRRIDNIVRSMMQDSIENIDEKNHTYLYERDMDINRLTYLAFRLIKAALNDPALAKTYEMTGLELLHVYSLINSLEKVADQVKRISRCVAKFDFSKQKKNDIKKIYSSLQKSFLDVMKSYHTSDLELAFEVELNSRARIDMCNELKYECPHTSRIIEHMKSLSTGIKNISRCIVGLKY